MCKLIVSDNIHAKLRKKGPYSELSVVLILPTLVRKFLEESRFVFIVYKVFLLLNFLYTVLIMIKIFRTLHFYYFPTVTLLLLYVAKLEYVAKISMYHI